MAVRATPDSGTVTVTGPSASPTAAAHREHEARTGATDADWPAWYARYLVREQSGEQLPA